MFHNINKTLTLQFTVTCTYAIKTVIKIKAYLSSITPKERLNGDI